MPESTMICLDNSEWMRNGDYVPTRMEAQHDAANLLCGTKTNSNPENTVGVLTMAGKCPELLVSPTDDMGKILSSLHNLPIHGASNFAQAVQIAQLALKHRRNKVGEQRIIIFVASPLSDEPSSMVKVGKLLKKNNVAIDVISMGEIEDNQGRLEAFIEAANSDGSSHLVTIPSGMLPSDVLISSPIISGAMGGGGGGGGDEGAGAAAAAGGAGGGGGGFADFGGVDPNMDPELAMALRVSMEEERARQEAAAAESGGAAAGGEGEAVVAEEAKAGDLMEVDAAADAAATAAETPAAAAAAATPANVDDHDALLQQALAMSVEEEGGADGMDKEEYEAMKLALQMSMSEEPDAEAEPPAGAEPAAVAAAVGDTAAAAESSGAAGEAAGGGADDFIDPAFVQNLLGQIPGVDQNDPRIKAAMAQVGKKEEEKKDDESKK